MHKGGLDKAVSDMYNEITSPKKHGILWRRSMMTIRGLRSVMFQLAVGCYSKYLTAIP